MARLAVLGCGRMGEALVAGLIGSSWAKPGEIVVSDPLQQRLSELSGRHGVLTTPSNAEAIAGAELVVIAVKPQDVDVLLAGIGSHVRAEQVVLSVVAGVPTRFIEARLPNPVPVVRAMPNTPALVHEGMAGIAGGRNVSAAHLALAEEVLGRVGRVVILDESYLDAVTAMSGSGPAYFALLAEAMIEAGVLLGLAREVSSELVIQTMFGSAKLLRDEGMHPVELREMVTSPGGTTASAMRVLERSGIRAAFLDAIQSAMERSQRLSRQEPEVET